MTTQITKGYTPLQDALYALSLAQPAPDAAVLDDLIRRYPHYAVELTDMAIALALDALCDDDDEQISEETADTSPVVLRAMSRFHNRLHTIKSEQRVSAAKTEVASPNPFTALNTPEVRALGRQLNANTVFTLKLRDRIIEAETMTEGFKRHVADELKAPFDIVAAHFAEQTAVAAHVHYKADQKPEAGSKQTFEEAVRTSGLTAEQQRYLRSL
jgi:hypothetical protein